MVRMSDILKKGKDKDKKGFKFSSAVTSKRKKKQPEKKKASAKGSEVRISPVIKGLRGPSAQETIKLYQDTILLIKEALNTQPQDFNSINIKKIAFQIELIFDRLKSDNLELLILALSEDREDKENNYLPRHLVNTTVLSLLIGLDLGFDKDKLIDLGISAFLYDIGMVNYQDIFTQPKQLSIEEYNAIKNHPKEGAAILAKVDGLPKAVVDVAAEHHERIDGFGYPEGKKENQIEDFAKIISFIDVYEALTHKRSYRQASSPFEAIKIILKEKQSFDLKIVKSFLQKIGLYPPGSMVLLNTKEVAKVIKHNPQQPLAPKVLVIADAQGREADGTREVDLSINHAVQIIKCLGSY